MQPGKRAAPPGGALITLGAVDGVQLTLLRADSFAVMPLSQQRLVHRLVQACEAGARILYAQHHEANPEIKDLLETLLIAPSGLRPDLRRRVETYLKRFWLHRGHHDLRTGKKFTAPFTHGELLAATREAVARRVNLGPGSDAELVHLLRRLGPHLFDPSTEPTLSDAVDFYRRVTPAEARAFVHRHPRNSRLVKNVDRVEEEVYRAGGAGAREGLYVNELHHVVKHLTLARALAGGELRRSVDGLRSYLMTGEEKYLSEHSRRWGGAGPGVIMGFNTTHRDPLGLKGTFQAMISAGCVDVGKVKECELLFMAGDPGPRGSWEVPSRVIWNNLETGRGPRFFVPPSYVAVQDRSGEVTGFRLQPPRSWVGYNLARARAWRAQNNKALILPPATSPTGSPVKGRLLAPARAPLNQVRLQRIKKKGKRGPVTK